MISLKCRMFVCYARTMMLLFCGCKVRYFFTWSIISHGKLFVAPCDSCTQCLMWPFPVVPWYRPFQVLLVRSFLNDSENFTTVISFSVTFNIRCIFVIMFLFFKIFSAFLIIIIVVVVVTTTTTIIIIIWKILGTSCSRHHQNNSRDEL